MSKRALNEFLTLQEMADAYGRWHAEQQRAWRDRQLDRRIRRLFADMNGRYRANHPDYVEVDGELMPLREFQERMGWL